jgi:hypothetical protein
MVVRIFFIHDHIFVQTVYGIGVRLLHNSAHVGGVAMVRAMVCFVFVYFCPPVYFFPQ